VTDGGLTVTVRINGNSSKPAVTVTAETVIAAAERRGHSTLVEFSLRLTVTATVFSGTWETSVRTDSGPAGLIGTAGQRLLS